MAGYSLDAKLVNLCIAGTQILFASKPCIALSLRDHFEIRLKLDTTVAPYHTSVQFSALPWVLSRQRNLYITQAPK